jgi:anti-sigma factor RsiW
MNCNEVATLVARYVDGEVDDLQRRTIEQHLRGCANCAALQQAALALRDRIRSEVPRYEATPALRERVRAMLADTAAAEAPRPQPLRERWRWLVSGAVAGCAATIMAWTVGTTVLAWHTSDDVAAEAVAMHVRATLNNHLIQVASSDQHTVKPWLSARLDYSPPVRDFSSEGFTLNGGRLDMLDKQRVATLVYQYRLHMIDVFVRPETAGAAPTMRTVRGFNVAHATGAGMDWLAVSDVSPDVLKAFVERLARDEGAP